MTYKAGWADDMDPQLAKILAAVARIETTLADLKEVSVKRLDSHASDITSLNLTRARQRGGAGIIAGLGASVMAYLKFWG